MQVAFELTERALIRHGANEVCWPYASTSSNNGEVPRLLSKPAQAPTELVFFSDMVL